MFVGVLVGVLVGVFVGVSVGVLVGVFVGVFGIQRAISASARKACSKLPALVNREAVEGRQVTNQRNV